MCAASANPRCNCIRYSDQGSYCWLWKNAPFAWQGKVNLCFANVPISSLRPAGCRTSPATVAAHLRHLRQGRTVAPPVVCANGEGGWYIQDGNHRYEALREFFGEDTQASVRVAVAVPTPGFQFVYRWFGDYGTFLAEPADPLLERGSLFGRTLILVAHEDDETTCAGLLQRVRDPIVAYATNGAPSDEYFWGRYGSREKYAALRRSEAEIALSQAGVKNISFLNDEMPPGVELRDQQLHRMLPEAFSVASDLVRRHCPDSIFVPAYEGGHPDHDSCSFLAALLQRRFGLPVWEMPLYHRSQTGALICQQFRSVNGTERSLMLSREERQVRGRMIASYASQRDVSDFVSSDVEFIRPQQKYDYDQPPHSGTVNYEAWRWAVSSGEVCRAFAECSRRIEDVQRGYTVGSTAPEHEGLSVSLAGAERVGTPA